MVRLILSFKMAKMTDEEIVKVMCSSWRWDEEKRCMIDVHHNVVIAVQFTRLLNQYKAVF